MLLHVNYPGSPIVSASETGNRVETEATAALPGPVLRARRGPNFDRSEGYHGFGTNLLPGHRLVVKRTLPFSSHLASSSCLVFLYHHRLLPYCFVVSPHQ